jgi:molecular chaperone IbpA
MNAYDLAPLFRSGVGFDRLARLAESASRMAEPSTSYPPYNIERLSAPEDQGERGDAYAITVAVAGFAESDLSVDVEGQTLTITGHKERADKQEDTRVLHRGIALRDFVRRFQLADNVTVTGADLKDGLLTVSLKRVVPEADKPRRIAIGSGPAALPSATPTSKADAERQVSHAA